MNYDNHLLNDKEKEVMALLSEAYNKYRELPQIHPLDAKEFVWGIHICQMIIHSRPSMRAEGFSGDNKEDRDEHV